MAKKVFADSVLCQVNFFGLLDEYKKLLMLLRSPQSPKRRRRVVSAALSDAFALSLAKVCHHHHLGASSGPH